MDADGPGTIPSPGTEEGTIARKRSRRVSFADTTAVHVFDRDEDFETPPEERWASPSPSPGRSSAEAEEGDDSCDAGFPAPPIVFLPDMDSSSPGSAAGSVASVDDENFFGPVISTRFIQTGRPSDSGMSEDGDHDITLDSRTFSMHFLSTAPPQDCTANSVGSLKTPDTACKGSLEELNVSKSGRKSSSGRDALTDMSLLTDNPRTYGFGKLSPMLNVVMQKIEQGQQRNSSIAGITDVNPDVLALTVTEEERKEDNSCIGNGISSCGLGAFSVAEEHSSMINQVSTSTDPIQEDNMMITNGLERSQENCNHGHVAVDPGVNDTVEPQAKLGQQCNSVMSNFDLQSHHLFHESLSDQPSNSNGVTCASSTSNLHLEHCPLDKPSSGYRLPEADNIMNASQLSSADPVFCRENAEKLHQHENGVIDTENILCTPKTIVQQLEGSLSSLPSKRQKLFTATPLSNCKIACPEASSLSVEFVKSDQRISALENMLKFRIQESPAASWLPSIERNELGLQANDIFRNAEIHAPASYVSCNSVPRQQLKKTSESSTPGTTPGKVLNEAANVQPVSCDAITLDSQLDHREACKAARSPKKTRKQMNSASELSMLLKVFKEKQSGDNDSGQSVNVDWNKVVCAIANATEQVLAASISNLNLQQLNTLGDKLDDFQMVRKYRRLSTAVRVKDFCGDKQKRLAEAQSLHEKLLYERAKLQINNMKLAKLRNKAQQCQIGIQECSFLESKILGSAQMNNASLRDTSLINSGDRQEWPAFESKKLEYNIIQQKVENLRSSLECFRNNKANSSFEDVMRSAEEQSYMRNQCRVIHRQEGLPELMDVIKRDNKHDVIVNYCNLLFQRIVLNTINISSIFVNNSLNGAKIRQAFPDLDALVAFNYVFKAEENQSVSDFQLLQKKTMETSLLLGNLVDVLDEIKFAKMKLLNLTSAAFVLESKTCQLLLYLCFMSFNSGKRIGFTIDMTDLNRCVYPSEPSELLIKLCQAETTLSQPSIEETMVSIRNLQPGRTVILRLCRMVSQLIQSLPC